MGREYITYTKLPQKLKCPNCGSTHIMIRGARKVVFEREEIDGEKIDEEELDVEEEIVYDVQCLEYGEIADLDEIHKWNANL